MAIRKIKVTSDQWGLDWDCILEFDTESTIVTSEKTYTLDENLRLSLEFFSGGTEAIEDAEGDLCIAYAKFIAHKILLESMEWNLDGIIRSFVNAEGYLSIDGTQGVKLIRADDYEIEEEFSAVEIKD